MKMMENLEMHGVVHGQAAEGEARYVHMVSCL